jgi:pyrimidine deaminase RibD-like protein
MDADLHTKTMALAVKESLKCIPCDTAYNVGAVIVSQSGQVLSTGYSRELAGNTHAEECCIIKLKMKYFTSDISDLYNLLRGSTLYTTMEPCGLRLSGKHCCADLISEYNISKVVYAIKEPDVFVSQTTGIDVLTNKGIQVIQLYGFENECYEANRHLFKNRQYNIIEQFC